MWYLRCSDNRSRSLWSFQSLMSFPAGVLSLDPCSISWHPRNSEHTRSQYSSDPPQLQTADDLCVKYESYALAHPHCLRGASKPMPCCYWHAQSRASWFFDRHFILSILEPSDISFISTSRLAERFQRAIMELLHLDSPHALLRLQHHATKNSLNSRIKERRQMHRNERTILQPRIKYTVYRYLINLLDQVLTARPRS